MADKGTLHLMKERHTLSDKLISHCLNIDYGIDVATLTFLPIGADPDASVYKAQTHDHQSYFVKLKRGHHHDISIVILELLHDAGIQQVIPPIKTVLGRPSQRIEGYTLIVYPFVNGQDGFSRDLTDKQWSALGKVLRQVHEIEVPPSIQHQLRKERYSPKWREAVRSLYAYSEESGFMKEKMPAIRRLVDRAEQLGQKLQGQSPQFVLCHSDIHGGNVLMEGDETIYIVDWDDPIMAPKERDLMFIGGGVANVWNKPHEEELFYKGYGRSEINSTLLAYYRHERIVEDIAFYGHELLLKGRGGEISKQFVDMFAPRGVVEIAFETDRGLSD